MEGYGGICVTSDNSNFKCWGLNNRGQLGSGNTTNLTSPTSVTFGLTGVTKWPWVIFIHVLLMVV